MRMQIKEREFSTIIIILAVIVVIILGVLQYRWSNQVSEATSIRLADSLQMSMINWHLDFFRVFSEICLAMQVDSDTGAPENWDQYARRYAEWKKTTANPNLVAGVYIARLYGIPAWQVRRLAPFPQLFESVDWPSEIGPLHDELQQAGANTLAATSDGAMPAASADVNGEFANRFYAGGPLAGWQFEPRVPALVHSISNHVTPGALEGNGRTWIVLVLDRNDLQSNILPALAERYFRGTEGLDYQVAVTSVATKGHPLYSSDTGFGSAEIADADGTMNIFGRPRATGQSSPIHIFIHQRKRMCRRLPPRSLGFRCCGTRARTRIGA